MVNLSFALIFLLQPASAPTSMPTSAPTSQPATQPAKPAATQTGWTDIHRGAPLTQTDTLTMDDIAAKPADFAGQTVRVAGLVKNVCRKKGCWMILSSDKTAAKARVTFKDYAFFVPLDSKDSKAVVEGIVEVKTLSEGERKHLADDAGKPVSEVPAHEIRLMAHGVSLTR